MKVKSSSYGKAQPSPAQPAVRPVHFAQIGDFVDTCIYERRGLPIGFAAAGPAVIQEYGSATLIGPDDRFEIGKLGEIRVHIGIGR